MKYAEQFQAGATPAPHDMAFRVIYGRVFSDRREAEKAAASVKDFSPSVKPGKGSFFVELGRYGTRQEADSAYFCCRGQGLRVFIQKLEA